MAAELLFDHDRTCWVIRDSPPGAAGSAVVRLGALLIAVDVADGHLVEVVFDEYEVGAMDNGLSDADVRLLDALFGKDLTRWLNSARAQESYETQLVVGPTWEAVRGLALALLFQRLGSEERRLMALDVALHAQRVGEQATDLLQTACWETLPALTALGQLMDRHPQLLQRLSTAALGSLRERVGVVAAVLATEGLAESSSVASRRLAELAAALASNRIAMSDSEVNQRWRDLEAALPHHPEREAVVGIVPEYQFVAAPEAPSKPPAIAPAKVVGVDWSARTTDVAVRSGWRARALLEGARCIALGRVPGQVVVRVPLSAGASEEDVADISVRLLTRRGELLARAPLQLDLSEIDLPVAVAKLTVDRAEAGAQRASDRDQVFVDLALDALPDLDSEAIAGLTRGQGFRDGQHAVAARKEGRRLEAVQRWRSAARLFELASEHELALQAAAQAAATFSAESTPEWRAQLIEAVDDLARRVLASDNPAERGELGRLGVELSMIAGATATLAAIHARLGSQRGFPADSAENETERTAHLTEAIRILRTLGDQASLGQARALSEGAAPS